MEEAGKTGFDARGWLGLLHDIKTHVNYGTGRFFGWAVRPILGGSVVAASTFGAGKLVTLAGAPVAGGVISHPATVIVSGVGGAVAQEVSLHAFGHSEGVRFGKALKKLDNTYDEYVSPLTTPRRLESIERRMLRAHPDMAADLLSMWVEDREANLVRKANIDRRAELDAAAQTKGAADADLAVVG